MAWIECREEDVPKVVATAGIVLVVLIVAVAWANVRIHEPKPPAPLTVNVTVEKVEHVKPTLESILRAVQQGQLPKLEERK